MSSSGDKHEAGLGSGLERGLELGVRLVMRLPVHSLPLPAVSGVLMLPEVKLEGMVGGSITIECPLPEVYDRVYLCRETAKSQACFTVVSSMNFVRKEYKNRVTLKLCPDQNVFLVEVTELTESDSGVYACGKGRRTDWGKTQKVTLDVRSGRCPT